MSRVERNMGSMMCRESVVALLKQRILNRPDLLSTNNALLRGLAWLIVGTIAAWHLCLVPTSMLGYTADGYIPLIWHVALALTMWIAYGVVYFALGVMLNRQATIVEIFGRLLFAHWPLTLMLAPAIFINRVAYATYMSDVVVSFKIYPYDSIVMTIVAVIVVVWALYWGYVAFRHAVQRNGVVMLVCYIVATLAAYYLSTLLLGALYRGIAW